MRLLPVAAVLVLVLAGCSQETPGTALPGDGSQQSSEGAVTTEPSGESSSAEPDSPLADVAPCDLLTEEGATTLGVAEGEERTVGEARNCRWRIDGATLADSFTLDLAIYDDRGIDDVSGTNVQPRTIGSHEAVTLVDATGGCVVSIAAGPSSRVDTLASGGNVEDGCVLAMRLATLVEPQIR